MSSIVKENKKAGKGNDYAVGGILWIEDTLNYVMNPEETNTHDEERLWDYWREDPMLHIFHSLYHRLYEFTYPRRGNFRRFYFAHHQMKVRAAIERRMVGLPELGIAFKCQTQTLLKMVHMLSSPWT